MMKADPYDNDLSSKSGAERIAEQLKAHWKAKGFPLIATRVFPVKTSFQTRGSRSPIYGVVSNIGPTGYPPRSA